MRAIEKQIDGRFVQVALEDEERSPFWGHHCGGGGRRYVAGDASSRRAASPSPREAHATRQVSLHRLHSLRFCFEFLVSVYASSKGGKLLLSASLPPPEAPQERIGPTKESIARER